MRCHLATSSANYATPKALRECPFPGARIANRCHLRHTLPIPERCPAPRRSLADSGSTESVTPRRHTRHRISLLPLPAFPRNLQAPGMRQFAHPPTGVSALREAHDSVGPADQGVTHGPMLEAAARVGLTKRTTCHTFRDACAAHLLEGCYDIRTVRGLLCQKDVKMAMVYTHVLDCGSARGLPPGCRACARSV